MNFDINKVLGDMLGAIKGSVEEGWEEVKTVADQFLQRKRNASNSLLSSE